MEIVSRQNYHDLLDYIPCIKSTIKEWKLVDIRLTDDSEKYFTISRMADLVHSLFRDKEGKIYLCNEREIFMLIRWGKANDSLLISRRIEERISATLYELVVHEPTLQGLQWLEMLIRYEKSGAHPYTDVRCTRRENIVLVAADEKYLRALLKMCVPKQFTIKQATDGNTALAAYKKYVPDVVFLDSEMNREDNVRVLEDILFLDQDAYVIMLTPDCPRDTKPILGAKGIIPIPFSPDQVMESLKKCNTLS